MKHVLLKLIFAGISSQSAADFIFIVLLIWGTPMDLFGSSQFCDQGNNSLIFYYQVMRETGRGVLIFFFSPGSQFPKEMRHVPSSCVEGEVKQSQSQGVLPAEGATFFEVRCGNRQRLLFSPLQLSTCETEPGGGMEPALAEPWRLQKHKVLYRQLGVTTLLRASSLL